MRWGYRQKSGVGWTKITLTSEKQIIYLPFCLPVSLIKQWHFGKKLRRKKKLLIFFSVNKKLPLKINNIILGRLEFNFCWAFWNRNFSSIALHIGKWSMSKLSGHLNSWPKWSMISLIFYGQWDFSLVNWPTRFFLGQQPTRLFFLVNTTNETWIIPK